MDALPMTLITRSSEEELCSLSLEEQDVGKSEFADLRGQKPLIGGVGKCKQDKLFGGQSASVFGLIVLDDSVDA